MYTIFFRSCYNKEKRERNHRLAGKKKLNYRLDFTDLVGPSSQSEKAMESRWDAIESDGIMLQMISIKRALV